MSTTLHSGQRATVGARLTVARNHQPESPASVACCSSRDVHAATARRRRAWLVFAGLTAMFVLAALWRPADEPSLVLCPFRALTHYPCPGCGMTRAFCALAHFELWRAVRFNALSPLLFLSALLAWASAAATLLRTERVRFLLARLPRPTPLATRIMLAFVMLWWATRLAGGF
jgi:hypothetical protein